MTIQFSVTRAESLRRTAQAIAELVIEKQTAYGDSFGRSGEILRVLYPTGIAPSQYDDVLTTARIIDKLFRVASDKRAFGESPWRDVHGYALLADERDSREMAPAPAQADVDVFAASMLKPGDRPRCPLCDAFSAKFGYYGGCPAHPPEPESAAVLRRTSKTVSASDVRRVAEAYKLSAQSTVALAELARSVVPLTLGELTLALLDDELSVKSALGGLLKDGLVRRIDGFDGGDRWMLMPSKFGATA